MKAPLITMSAITGKPTEKEIYDYLLSLKEHGIDQAMLYPRSGCEIEYLSEEWFDTVGYFIHAARSLDMYLWLYDDFNWPSGDAGGRVTAKPEFRLKALCVEGENAGQIVCKSRHNAGLFGEKYFPDLLSHEAVEYFIRCTHEEYYKRFGEHFGTVIRGIFTDEPSIGYCCGDGCIPYYEGIEDEYYDFCGRKFETGRKSPDSDFYYNAVTVISNRFRTCYLDTLCNWCKAHGIKMTGHLMCDNEPFWAARHHGNTLKNLSRFSLPGMDEIASQFEDRTEMALFGTIEYASSENGAMAELFALGPCDMSYAKRRAMLYLAACHKVDHYFLAISPLDLRGNRLIKDYFNDFSDDSPDFIGMQELAKEAKHAATLAKKDYCPDVYVRYPYEASAKRITENTDRLALFSLLNTLTYRQIQWKFIDDEHPTDAPILTLNEDLVWTMNGKAVDLSSLSVAPLVTDTDGSTPDGIFVRRFEDGAFLVLNLFAPAKEYRINGAPIFLDQYDVYDSDAVRCENRSESFSPVFRIHYKNDTIVRTMHVPPEERAEIVCACDTPVVFALRNDTEATLDGKPIAVSETSDALPRGMRELYRMSGKHLLKKGAHTITAKEDLKYLPAVLLLGDFRYEATDGSVCTLKLSERARDYTCGEALHTYGGVAFEAEVSVPEGVTGLEVCGTELVTQVCANGTPLGTCAFAPYAFPVDPSLWNQTICLKIIQLSSLSPIFGNVDFWDKTVPDCGWRGTPSPTHPPFGFTELRWLF